MNRNLTDDVDEHVLSQTFGEFGTMEKVKTIDQKTTNFKSFLCR